MSEAIIAIRIERLQGGGYLATSRALPGLVAQGSTVADTIHIAHEAARRIVDGCFERGEPLPTGVAPMAAQAVEVGVAIELPEAQPAPPAAPRRRRGEID